MLLLLNFVDDVVMDDIVFCLFGYYVNTTATIYTDFIGTATISWHCLRYCFDITNTTTATTTTTTTTTTFAINWN